MSNSTLSFLATWTPRTAVAIVGGYYGLGFAYEMGWMAAIDQLAIPILKSMAGYFGVGLIMPTFQWYAAWAVRITLGLCAGLVYDLTERLLVYLVRSPQVVGA
jgi:hypothetical protein